MIRLICLLLLSFNISLADDVYLKDGSVFRNVQVIDTLGNSLRCKIGYGMSVQVIPLNTVERIVFSAYDMNQASVFDDATAQRNITQNLTQRPTTTFSTARLLLPVGLLSLLLSWDYLTEESDIQKTINILKAINKNADVSSLEESKKRKEFIGFACAAIAAITIVYSVHDLVISANSNEIRLSYCIHR